MFVLQIDIQVADLHAADPHVLLVTFQSLRHTTQQPQLKAKTVWSDKGA